MKSTLPATHLVRHFALFAIIALFLLTMIRASYGLWQFGLVANTQMWVDLFKTGVRYDLALIGALLLPPMIVVSVLGMLGFTRALARYLLIGWMMLSMAYILLTEFITPYFMMTSKMRPDLAMITGIKNPGDVVTKFFMENAIPAAIGVLVMLLVFVAYQRRLDIKRILKFPLALITTPILIIVGSALCILAIRSEYDLDKPALSPSNSLISKKTVLNEMTMNSGYKIGYSLVQPWVSKL